VGLVLSGTDSIRVFQALQLGHLPSHLGLIPPQSEQTNWVFSLAMGGMIRVKTTDGMRRLQHAASYALVGQNRHGHSVADLGSDPNSAQRPSNSSRAYPRIGL